MTRQGVKATATRNRVGNSVKCLLPFAVIDRWSDDFDNNKDNTFFLTDSQPGTIGWSQNDTYQPDAPMVAVGPCARISRRGDNPLRTAGPSGATGVSSS
jgi:hypothetical protein